MDEATLRRILAFAHPAWMIGSLALAVFTARLGLEIRRRRRVGEPIGAALRARHLAFGRRTLGLVAAGFVLGAVSMVGLRERALLDSFHGVLGVIVGWLFPAFATNEWVKAMGDGFIKLIKMVIAPIIFCTVVSGISHIQEAKKVGRVAVKALIYFEIVSTFALALGLIVANVVQPGVGFSGKTDAAAVAGFAKKAGEMKSVDFVLHIIPDAVVGAFAQGEILQVLLFSILFGCSLMVLGERGHTVRALIDDLAHAIFGVIAIVVRAAPIGAFGAMAYTIGKFGPQALGNLADLLRQREGLCIHLPALFSSGDFRPVLQANYPIVRGKPTESASKPRYLRGPATPRAVFRRNSS